MSLLQSIQTKTLIKRLNISKYLFLLATIFFSLVSQAIIIRHDTLDQHYRQLAKNYSASVAYLDRCVATVLSNEWLITAAHCVSVKSKYPLQISHLDIKYPVEEIVVNPNAEQFDDLDIALLRLKWPLDNAKPVSIYEKSDELGKQVVFVGKGLTGTGLTGDKTRDKIERAATNTVNKVEENWLSFSFDKPVTATELEGVSGVEDSGGPAFIFSDNGIKIAGVGCCQLPVVKNNKEELQGGYLSTEYYSRLSSHRAWIEKQINRTLLKEGVDSPILQALKFNKFDVVKLLLNQNNKWLDNPKLITEILIYSFFRSNEFSYFLLNSFPKLHKHRIQGMPLTAYAYRQGNGYLFSLLIKLGVAMDYSGFKGQKFPSLLTWQYFDDDYSQHIKLLIHKGFDINASDERGDTALHMAIYLGWPERVTTLLDLGADINKVDNKGNSALIDAARSGKSVLAKLLVDRGANIALVNQQQKNASQSAEEAGFNKLATYL
jgi:ankyrin repeat protein